MKQIDVKPLNTKLALHPRNKHRQRYNFDQLIQACPSLAAFVKLNQYHDASIDFSNANAVKALNQALLKQFYHVYFWEIPKHYLCPAIPGRADYIHYLADLLAASTDQASLVHVLDIGVGANVIYPLIGNREYGWQFVGADIDEIAINNAQQIIDANQLSDAINLRLQSTSNAIFKGIIQTGEYFDITMCNPPFHASLADAQAGTQRKWRALSKANIQLKANKQAVKLNFGGKSHELYCKGGEEAFIINMINESKHFAKQCNWFSTLISKASTLPNIYRELKKIGVHQVKTIAMQQGQKPSRIVAWSFR